LEWADRFAIMDEILAWNEAMSGIYAGKKRRKEFARDIVSRLDKIEGKIAKKKRNLKTEYFKELIARPDGWILVECMAHLRKEFGDVQKKKVLSMILKEWEGQTEVPDSYDTFHSVLINHEKAETIHICNALILQARRLRGKAGVKPKNAKAAKNLVKEAKEIWERKYIDGDEKLDDENFCLVPNRFYKYVIDIQEIFCNARFSNMQRVWGNAKDMADQLDKEVNWEGNHKPNLILKWWMYQVKLRASAVCIEPVKWKQAKDGMEEVEKKFEGHTCSYFEDIRGKSHEFEPTKMKKKSSYNDLDKMRDLLSDWSEFYLVDEKVLKFRRRGGVSTSTEDKKLKDAQNDFTHSLKVFNKYLQMGASSGFVSHAYARDSKQRKRRLSKILEEMSEGRRYVTRSDTNHSCFQLEILHRLLVYRIWWEMVGQDPDDDDAVVKRLSRHVPGKILRDIKYDLEKIHIDRSKNARWKKDINESIEVFGRKDKKLVKNLKYRIEKFDDRIRPNQWPDRQKWIMGLPYNPHPEDPEEKISPYEVMDPTMRHVGVNAAGAGEELRSESQ